MDIVVYKLGGSILRGREDLGRIVDVAESELGAGRVPVCVVSAMKGVTDRIIQALSQVRVEGFICPGPNCTTVGLTVSLKPLMDAYGVRAVHVVSEQALSGAGERGLRLDSPYRKSVEMNVLPYIEGEEAKVEKETNKILGKLSVDGVKGAGIAISATCTRVHVQTVHTEAAYVDTKKPCSADDAKEAMRGYVSEPQKLKLPSAPEKPIIVFDEPEMPQPKLHRKYGGDVTLVGRLRKDPVFRNGLAYVVTSDNLDKGAGGGAVQTAEYLRAKRYF